MTTTRTRLAALERRVESLESCRDLLVSQTLTKASNESPVAPLLGDMEGDVVGGVVGTARNLRRIGRDLADLRKRLDDFAEEVRDRREAFAARRATALVALDRISEAAKAGGDGVVHGAEATQPPGSASPDSAGCCGGAR